MSSGAGATSRAFVSGYGALTRVDDAAAPRQVPVPRETWSRIAAVSPSFALVHNHLQGPLGDIWLGPSAKLLGRLMDADPSVRNWLSRRLQVAVPAGNTGGAGVSGLRRLPVPDALQRAISASRQ